MIVGSGAQIVGPITVGAGARVGANAVATKDVPSYVTVVGIPAQVVVRESTSDSDEFCPYGTPLGDLPDPVARSLEGLIDHVTLLQARIEELEQQLTERPKKTLDPEFAEEGDIQSSPDV